MDMILSENLNAAIEMSRHGGFALKQRVLSRLRNLATMGDEDECLDVGALQAHADGPTTFGVQSHNRAKAREAFVRWDCGERVRRAALRKAALVVGSYQVGDIVSCGREARAGEHALQWGVGSRLLGFEKDRNSFGATQPRTCWVICDTVPVCVAFDRLRSCTSAELLVFHNTQTKGSSSLRQTLRHNNKASSMNVLRSIRQFLIHHEMPMKVRTKMSKTTKRRSQHN